MTNTENEVEEVKEADVAREADVESKQLNDEDKQEAQVKEENKVSENSEAEKSDSGKSDFQERLDKKLGMLDIVGVFHDENSGLVLGVTSTGAPKLISKSDADVILACMSVVSPGKESYALGDGNQAEGTVKELDQTKMRELDEKGDKIQEQKQKEGTDEKKVEENLESSKEEGSFLGWTGPAAGLLVDIGLRDKPLPEGMQKGLEKVHDRALKNITNGIGEMINKGAGYVDTYLNGGRGGRP